jgi:uncharacterized protein
MPPTTQSLTEAEFDELDEFLLSEEMPEKGMDISTLDGFLAAIVLNPDMILPSQWLPWVWDMDNAEESPEFGSIETASRITNYIMRHYNMVLRSINEGWFDPLFFELVQPDGSEFFDAEGWCEGFMFGVSMFQDTWKPVLENHTLLIAPMVLLGTEMGRKIMDESGDSKRVSQEAYESIPAAVDGLRAYFMPLRDQATGARIAGARRSISTGTVLPFQRGEEKVGRNAPCPCGSGKKFKKCCGVTVLH